MLQVQFGTFFGKGLLDSGADASAITLRALKKFDKFRYVPANITYNTTSTPGSIIGITALQIKIMNVMKTVILFVIDPQHFHFDFIIGTDCISLFRLNLDHKLNVSQSEPISFNVTSLENNLWNDYFTHELFDNKIKHLDGSHRLAISDFIIRNHKVFARDKFDVGNVRNYSCSINLSSNSYVTRKPYRCSHDDQQIIDRQCQTLLSKGMISESSSPYASPVTLQYKKDGLEASKIKDRMCVDFRDLNKLVIPESQPFPLIEDVITTTSGSSWFSAMDINSAFHSIPIRAEDRHKSAFVTQSGHFEWNVLPFGLKTSAAVFQRILSGIIRRHKLNHFAINYLDDILIYSSTFEEHLIHIQKLVDALFAEGFRLNFKKCSFAKSSVQYLGHMLSSDSVRPLSDNIAAITEFPVPTSRRALRGFLGKINFYRKFIPNPTRLLEPLHLLLRKNVSYSWNSESQTSFDTVKKLLTAAPILAVYDRNKPVSIFTDASGIGVGAVLKQTQKDGEEKPVAYFSKKLTEAQKKKKAIYIEALAIREAIRFWKFWLQGRRFTVYSDHKPLQHLNLKARPDEELGDLALELSQFEFDVIYRPGRENCEADCLSRNPVGAPSLSEPIVPTLNFLTIDDLKRMQSSVIHDSTDTIKHGIVFRSFRGKPYITLDVSAGRKLIDLIHEHYGHIGSKHVLSILRKYFTFPRMTQHVLAYCKRCPVCIINKTRRSRPSGKLGFLGPATRPFEIMSMDTIGGFSPRSSGLRYCHLLVDHFTRFSWILCTKGQTAKEMIRLIHSVQQRHQIHTLLTDQYGGLCSDEFQSYCSRSNIRHIFTAVDSPSSNGLNERLNQTLVNRIRCMKNNPSLPNSPSWATIARRCVDQYNSTPHSVTSFPPSYLLTGVPSTPLPSQLIDPPSYEADLSIALSNTIRHHEYNKRNFDKYKLDVNFKPGDLVYVSNGSKLNRDKLDPVRIGPFPIVRTVCNNVFEVNVGKNYSDNRLYHANKILII